MKDFSELKDGEQFWVRPAMVRPSAMNPRKYFDPEGVREMAESIREKGVVQPLGARLVADEGDGTCLELVWGERRWRGSMMCVEEGWRPDLEIPVIFRDLDDRECFELMVIENLERRDLTISEEARAYETEVERFGVSAMDVAKRFGRALSHVQRYLSLLELPSGVIARLDLPPGDPERVPLYAAELALKVPATVNGGRDRMEALELALEAGGLAAATRMVDHRWLRPAKERAAWESMRSELEDAEDAGVRVMSWEESRQLFPYGVTALTPVTARGWVEADADVSRKDMAAGWSGGAVTWGWLAARYGAPRCWSVDGRMEARLLTQPDLVREAARVAHTYVVTWSEEAEELVTVDGIELDLEPDSRVCLTVPGGGREDGSEPRLPSPLLPHRVYWVQWTDEDGAVGLKEDEGTDESLALEDSGIGGPWLLHDLSGCPFPPADARVAKSTAQADHVREEDEASREAEARVTGAREMLSELCAGIEGGAGGGPVFARALADLLELGITGFQWEQNPIYQLLDLLDCDLPDAEEQRVVDGWPGIESMGGLESLVVGAWVLYWLNLHEGENLRECGAWLAAVEGYGLG